MAAAIGRAARETLSEFMEDRCFTNAAALAYYAAFSLPPLLLILFAAATALFGSVRAETLIAREVSGLLGGHISGEVHRLFAVSRESASRGGWHTAFAIAVWLVAATTAFTQLQISLNRAWQVERDPRQGWVGIFFRKRIHSFFMVCGLGWLMLGLLVLSATVSSGGILPAALHNVPTRVVIIICALALLILVFAAVYRVLPDARIDWEDVWIGAGVTAVLFTAGNALAAWYVVASPVVSLWGLATALAVMLLWAYYSSLAILLGAEFTQVWTRQSGKQVVPEPGAVRTGHPEPGGGSQQPA